MGHPDSLIVTYGQSIIRHDPHAIGNAEAGAIDFGLTRIGPNFNHRAWKLVISVFTGLDVIQMSAPIHLQIEIEAMKEARDVSVRIPGFVKVGLEARPGNLTQR